jgi:hypothetical protein
VCIVAGVQLFAVPDEVELPDEPLDEGGLPAGVLPDDAHPAASSAAVASAARRGRRDIGSPVLDEYR